MSKVYNDGDGEWGEGTRGIIAGDLEMIITSADALKDLFRATFPNADLAAIAFTGESVEDDIGAVLDWCAQQRKLSDFIEAAANSAENGWNILTYTFSYLYTVDLIVDAEDEPEAHESLAHVEDKPRTSGQPMQQQFRDEAAEALRREQAGLRHDQ